MKAVLDTNILVSAFISKNPASPPVRILEAMLNGRFVPIWVAAIIAEYREVLSREKFGLDRESVKSIVDWIVESGEFAESTDSDEEFPDLSDKVFYCAALSKADDGAKLVTGNGRHFPVSPIVVTPAEFCRILGV